MPRRPRGPLAVSDDVSVDFAVDDFHFWFDCANAAAERAKASQRRKDARLAAWVFAHYRAATGVLVRLARRAFDRGDYGTHARIVHVVGDVCAMPRLRLLTAAD